MSLFLLQLMTGCSKKLECTHFHQGTALIELCSKNIECIYGEDETGTSKICTLKAKEETVTK